jgi:hypothetical protein
MVESLLERLPSLLFNAPAEKQATEKIGEQTYQLRAPYLTVLERERLALNRLLSQLSNSLHLVERILRGEEPPDDAARKLMNCMYTNPPQFS